MFHHPRPRLALLSGALIWLSPKSLNEGAGSVNEMPGSLCPCWCYVVVEPVRNLTTSRLFNPIFAER